MNKKSLTFPEEIRVAWRNCNMFTVHRTPDGGLEPENLDGRFLVLLSQVIGFKYKLVEALDEEWGTTSPRGNWTGVVGVVSRNEADISVNYMSVTQKRMLAIDYSEPYTETGLTFVTNLPELLPRKYLYLYPFSSPTWICLLVTLFALPSAIRKLQNAKRYAMDFFWMTYGNMLRQPVCDTDFIQNRLFVGFEWLVVQVLGMSYAAVILSFLTVPLFELSIKNFRDLEREAKRGEYAVVSLRGHSALELLSESKIDYLQSIAYMIRTNEWYKNYSTLGKRFSREEFEHHRKQAVLGPRFGYTVMFGRVPMSSKYISRDDATVDRIAVVVNKNFCCMDALNKAIRIIKHAGLYEKLQRKEEYKAWIRTYRRRYKPRPEEHRLTLEDISGAAFALLIGYAISITVFLCEIGITYGKKRGYLKKFSFDWFYSQTRL